MDGGTLYQLQNLRNVVTVPKNNVAACEEEFFLLVVEAHILAAAMSDDQPKQCIIQGVIPR